MHPMYLNVIHRVDPGPARLEALDFQLREAWQRDLRTTVLVTYSAMHDPRAVQVIRDLAARPEVELGIHTHALRCAAFEREFDTTEQAFYLLDKPRKERLIHRLCGLFSELTGRQPTVFGGYLADAWTLNFLAAAYPCIEAAITSCFEEGVKMFHGNNNNWMLLCDGGPWFPYFPSNRNALCPADGPEEWCGIVGFPHLNRDMSLALSSRDDLYSSHPVNLFRAGINDGADCPYNFAFIDEWLRQSDLNGFSYYSLFVSSPWLTDGHWAVDDVRDARKLYAETLDYLAQLQARGRVRSDTMAGAAGYYKSNHNFSQPTGCHWNHLLGGSKKQLYWHLTSRFRIAVDWQAGGTVVDLRAYGGRLNRDLGPDGPGRWNGNYPYLISSELRGGIGMSSMHGYCMVDDEKVSLITGRTAATVHKDPDGAWRVEGEPVEFETAAGSIRIQTLFRFKDPDGWTVERHVLDAPDGARLSMGEELVGTFGSLDYPEDMSGVSLVWTGSDGARRTRRFQHAGAALDGPACASVAAVVPMCGVRVALEAPGQEVRGVAREGTLFHPAFKLCIERKLQPGERLRVCARLENL